MAKQRRITKAEAVVGLKVVVNHEEDTYMYTIKEVNGNGVHLTYPTKNGEASGGWVDYGICMIPSLKQLRYANKTTSVS